MTLAPGTRLGPYEIVAPLGAGGMGEVYRARDTRLGRDVAVKVLPRHLSAAPEVRARFEREARTVSSLNHPHICTLFDVGRDGDTDYLVLELVEGETLAERLARGALPAAEVLGLGAQIADALDRAHRAGVVHRDLKPGNVMLAKSGAKLMDFGLARATGMAGPAGGSGVTVEALTQSPTRAAPLTAEGTIVGTFQYMAPEQLEGKEADARTDLWALGCVLYEMATGRRAFEGASQASLIAAIMHVAPAPLSQVAPLSPPALDRLVGACLAKDPADRVQSAHDVKLQLEWMAEGEGSGARPGAAEARGRPGRVSALRNRLMLAAALGLAALGFAAAAFLPRRTPTLTLQVPIPPELRLTRVWSANALSPDGRSVVAMGQGRDGVQRAWLWRLDSPDPAPLPGTERAYFPCWSPDSRSIAFFRQGTNGLFRLAVPGGTVTKVCDATWGRGASWGRRGDVVFAPAATGPLVSVSAGGGVPREVTALDRSRGEVAHRYPYFLPDGEHFLFAALPAGPRGFQIYAGSLGSRDTKRILEADCAPIYAEPGYLVFVQGGKVVVQRFDARRLEPVGERLAIADAPAPSDFTAEPVASASRDQRLLFPSIAVPAASVEWLDRGGGSRGALALAEGPWKLGGLSADARFATATTGSDLWRIDLDRALATRIATGVRPDLPTVWSPDGRRLAMDAEVHGRSEIQLLNAGGSGQVDSVRSLDALFQEVADWTPDGRFLLVAAIRSPASQATDTGWDLWTVPLAAGGSPSPYLQTPAFERLARLSPDGKWIACKVGVGEQSETFIDSYPIPGHRIEVAAGAGDWAMWGRNGREFLYVDAQSDLISLALEFANGEVKPGEARRLFRPPGDLTGLVTRDGERFLVSHPRGEAVGTSLRLTLAWTGLLAP